MLSQEKENHEKIFSILFNEDEITWKDIIYNLIKTEQMNPWDINVVLIAEKFLKTLEEMKKLDFRISGKIILAAAFLLKIKSDKLLTEDLAFFDDLINDNPEEFLDELEAPQEFIADTPTLSIKTPQPRKRKVSVYDLVEALEKALETGVKRSIKNHYIKKPQLKIEKKKDISVVITEVYEKIKETLKNVENVTFSQLTPGEDRHDKVFTFIPLLYLEAQKKIFLNQLEHFGEINIDLLDIKADFEAN